MNEKELRELIEQETAASEADREQPIGGGTVDRPNYDRSVVLAVRLNPDEFDAVQRLADAAKLPTSTLVRAWILERVRATADEVPLGGRRRLLAAGAGRSGRSDVSQRAEEILSTEAAP